MKLNFTKLSIYLIFHLLILYNFACTQKENSNLLIQKWLLTEIKDQTRIQKFQDEGEIYFIEINELPIPRNRINHPEIQPVAVFLFINASS